MLLEEAAQGPFALGEKILAQKATTAPAPEIKEATAPLYGYVVYVGKDNEIGFDVIGERPEVAGILGLHVLAGNYISDMAHQTTGTGYVGIARLIQSLSTPNRPKNTIAIKKPDA